MNTFRPLLILKTALELCRSLNTYIHIYSIEVFRQSSNFNPNLSTYLTKVFFIYKSPPTATPLQWLHFKGLRTRCEHCQGLTSRLLYSQVMMMMVVVGMIMMVMCCFRILVMILVVGIRNSHERRWMGTLVGFKGGQLLEGRRESADGSRLFLAQSSR